MSKPGLDLARRFGGIARLYGKEQLRVFEQSHVCVVGIGGVGSWVAESLARHGIGHITLIDMDHLAESNINRQIHALDSTMGASKVIAMRDRLVDINPSIKVEIVDDFLTETNIANYIQSELHFVIDAIDQTKVKIALAQHCLKENLPLLMTGGAGGRTDPTIIQIANLDKTFGDPLLAGIRKHFNKEKRENGQRITIPTVFSPEAVIKPEICEEGDSLVGLNCAGYGSSLNVTATFAFVAVSYVLKNLS